MFKKLSCFIVINFILFFSHIGLARPRKVDFLIIGAPQCGTTSLNAYLSKHPMINSATKPGQIIAGHKENGLLGGTTSDYFYHPLTPKLAKKSFPDAKFIVLLRNPIERAYSHYKYNVKMKKEHLSFDQAISKEIEKFNDKPKEFFASKIHSVPKNMRRGYFGRGVYIDPIKCWMSYFPKEQFLIIKAEDFFADPEATLKQVHQFLGIPHYSLDDHQYGYHPSTIAADEKVMAQLADYFRPYNKALEEFLGAKFNWDAA